MADRQENLPNSSSSNNQDFKKAIVYCILVCILCAVVSFFALFFNHKYSNNVLSIIINVALGLITIFSFFGIMVKINDPFRKAILIAALIGLAVGIVLANIIQEVHGSDDSKPQPSEPSQLESETSDAKSPPPTETVPSSMTVEDNPAGSPAPTEIPSHADPVTITPGPDSSDPADSYVIRDFYDLIDPNHTAGEDFVVPLASEKDFWGPVLADRIRDLVNTDTQLDRVLINGDKAFTSLTSAANRKAEDIKSNGRSLKKQQDLIELRESAYERYPTYGLRKLLSDDYFSLAKLYKSERKLEDAYHYYLKSIEYEFLAIRLCPEEGNDYFIHLYRLALRLHAIGDLQDLGTDNKIEAYYLSACLFESISKSSLSSESAGYQADSCYYAGIVNHKLMNLTWGEDDSNSSHYFLDSYDYYVASLNFNGDKKHKYSYLEDLCAWAQKYIRRFGKADGMLSSSEYKQHQNEYAELVLSVETDPPSDLS